MKLIAILSLFAFPPQAFAARDSVAVFHRPEKVVVLVNEAGRNSRLQNWFDSLGAGAEIYALSADKSININCGRSEIAVSCNFRFLPSATNVFSPRRVDVQTSLRDMQLNPQADSEVSFESDRQDRFVITIANGQIRFHAEKKIIAP